MNISELRIGNYLEIDGKFEMVSSIHSDNTIRLQESVDEPCHGCYSLNKPTIKPIKLTPEIMVLFGFEKIHNNIWQKRTKADRVLNLEEADGYIQHYVGFGVSESGYNMVQIHVHRLQNLYHALTGEELTLNKAL